ncbi:hypothetical protein [Saccharothrix hoggarensis]|uniref:Uncharacterized protein n=1 Tax=Saccharothrix hoggarensis TaxID=913853 RepID=A0ABW3QN34_9PSEU
MRRTYAPAPLVLDPPSPCAHEVDRAHEEVLARLMADSATRLALAPVPYADDEVWWVAYGGVLIGTVVNRTPEVTLGEWWATEAAGGEPRGPFRVARRAASSLLPERDQA